VSEDAVISNIVPNELGATVNEVPDETLEYSGRNPLRMVTPPFTSRAVAGVVVWIPKLELLLKYKFVLP
jgi:hypothetical protein